MNNIEVNDKNVMIPELNVVIRIALYAFSEFHCVEKKWAQRLSNSSQLLEVAEK